MQNKVNIAGVPVDKVTMEEAIDKVNKFLSEDKVHTIYTPNSEIMMEAVNDAGFNNILKEADLLVADGAGIVLASKILGSPLPEKVSGIDLVKNFLLTKQKRKIRYFLFGSKPGVAEAAGENLVEHYTDIEIAGCRNGYFSGADEKNIINNINSSNADILLVALGAPKQEKWIHTHKSELKVKVCIGVGGSLDVFAGKVKLAPPFFRNHGLEWSYRLYKEPWRFKRMLRLPKFILLVIAIRLGIKKFK